MGEKDKKRDIGFKMSNFGLIVLVAGMIAMLAFFLEWGAGLSGMDLFGSSKLSMGSMPMIVLIMGVAAIVMAMVEFMGFGSLVTKAIVIVIGIMVVVIPMIVVSEVGDYNSMGVGAYMETLAGMILILAPVSVMVGHFSDAKK